MTLAVIIPTRDRADLLRRCLDALAAQTVAPDEVVVVDDGSDPPLDMSIAVPARALPLRLLRQSPSRGPAAARNLGWRSTRSTHVAFTDDDCRPGSGWLAGLGAASGDDTIAVGRTIPDELDGTRQAITDRTLAVDACDGLFLTCNIVYPRALLERLGGFDETFVRPYGEDTDLGQRALEAGARATYVPNALVHHAIHHLSVGQLLRERRRLPELVRLARDYPHLRRQLWAGRFVNVEHRFLLEALAGLALLPVTPAGLAAIGRYLHRCDERRRGMPRRRRARDVAGWVALDAYEVALCAVGSARYRTVLL